VIKNPQFLKKFEDQFLEEEGPLPYDRAINILNALWQEAVTLGIFPLQDPWEGIESDLRMARILNSCSKKS
jgi:hypothetical protein